MKRNLLFNQATAIGKRLAMVLTMLLIVGIGQAWGAEVLSETFIFNSTDGIKALGLTPPSSGNGTNLDANKTYSMGIVSLKVAHGSTNTRIWNSSGSYDLRVYKSGGKLTFSVPSGYQITAIQHTGTTGNISTNVGSYNTGSWTGSAQSVIYTASGTLNLKKFVIVYEAINQSIDVTLHYNGTSKTLNNQTSPYTLPTTGDYVADACDDWRFTGWYGSEYKSTTAPTYITKLISTGSAYAVYSHTETIGGGAPTSTTTDNVFQNGTFANSTITWTLPNIVTIKQEQNGAQTAPNQNYINAPRWYAGNKITIKPDVNITTITVTTQSGYGKALSNATYGNATVAYNGTTVTITPIIGTNPIEIVIDDQARLNNLTITYKSGGGTSTTTYTSSPECTAEPTVTLNPNYPAGKTGEFIDTLSNTVSGNLEISLPAGTKSQAITKLYKSIALEGYIFEGWYEAADGDAHRENTGDISKDITFYAHWRVPYTVYFNAGTGTCTESMTETTADGIKLPTATLEDCGDWTFLGWAETAIESETTTAPASFLAGGSTYKPTANITLHAIYKRVEGGGNGEGTAATLTFDNTSKRTTLTTEQQVWEENDITLTNNKASSTSNIVDNSNPARFYKSSEIIISAPGAITKIVATTSGSEYTTALKNSVGAEASPSDNVVTITPSTSNNTYTINLTAGQVRLSSISVTYGAGLSTSYYHSEPYCQTCENFITINKGAETNGTFTLDISGEMETCDTEVAVVVKPTPANHYHIGSVTATTPTTGGAPTVIDNDNGTYTITYAANSTGTSTINVTFAEDAKATIKLYELGVLKTIATEYVGDKYTLPSTSSQSCGTKTLVGWSTKAFAETDTRPTENYYGISTQITLAETQTFYAVFAQSNGGGGGNGDYVRVTEDANDLSGEYLIVYEAGNLAFNGGLGTLDAASNTISVTINGNTIKSTDATDAAKFTIAKDGEGDYTIKSASGKYIGRTADDNELDENESTPYKNTITFTDGDVNIIASGGAYLRYNKNSGAERFRYYKSTTYTQQQPIALYKKSGSSASYTDYTTGCHDVTITYYGFTGGYTTNCGGSNLNVITTRVNSAHTIPSCAHITDPTNLGRTFLNLWKDQNGKVHQPGETFIVTQDITLYAQWALNTSENTTLPTDVEDLATTDIIVTGGKTLTIPEGETITVNSLTLKGGIQEDKSYAMPIVKIPDNATLVRKDNKINLDLKINNQNFYPFAVPFEVANTAANINYINTTLKEYVNAHNGYGTFYVIREYNGALRAENGANKDENWVHVGRSNNEKLLPGKGYIISAVPAAGTDTVTIRITMTVDNAWLADGEQESITVKEQTTTRNQVAVTAYTGTAATNDPCNAGWNFVANPYLTHFAGASMKDNSDKDLDYIEGEIIVNNGHFEHDGTGIPYVTVPAADFGWYDQYRVSDVKLSPMWSFFVQIGTDGTMNFTTAGRQQAPAALRASAAAANPHIEANLAIFRDEKKADHTGLIIDDRYTSNYEIGADLEKMFGSAYNTTIYTISQSTRLAYNALPHNIAQQSIPLGFRAAEEGEYTISLTNYEDIVGVESIILHDLYTGLKTNLLHLDYTFDSEATQDDNRFVVYIVARDNTTTDISTIVEDTLDKQNRKVLINNHLYIIHEGKMYNGVGQIVK